MRCLSPQRAVLLTVLSFLLLLFPAVAAQNSGSTSASTTTTTTTTTTTSSSSTSTSSSTSFSSTSTSSSSTSSSSSTTTTTTQPPLLTSSSSVLSSSSSSTPSLSSSSSVSSGTLVVVPSSTPLGIPGVYSTSYNYITSTDVPPSSSTDSAAGSINTLAASNKGFLANKAAMGGTFTVVALAALAIIGGLIYWFVKRHRRLRDEEEVDAYFEKPVNAGGYRAAGSHSTPSVIFPSTGAPAFAARGDYFASMGPSLDYPPNVAPFADARPPSAARGTAYAAALSQQGPYQYSGPSASKPGQSPVAPSSNPHPFADPGHRSGSSPVQDDPYAYDPYSARQ